VELTVHNNRRLQSSSFIPLYVNVMGDNLRAGEGQRERLLSLPPSSQLAAIIRFADARHGRAVCFYCTSLGLLVGGQRAAFCRAYARLQVERRKARQVVVDRLCAGKKIAAARAEQQQEQQPATHTPVRCIQLQVGSTCCLAKARPCGGLNVSSRALLSVADRAARGSPLSTVTSP
jgi:hypothetical protein